MEKAKAFLDDLPEEEFLEKFLSISQTPEFSAVIEGADDWTGNVIKTRRALLVAGLPEESCQKGSQIEKLARLIRTMVGEKIPA